MRRTTPFSVALLLLVLGLASVPLAQGTAPGSPLVLITPEGRRPVPTTIVDGQELIALTDVAALFDVEVREDALAGGVTLTHRGRTIVALPGQATVSVDGRVVSLPSPIVRSAQRWLVPLELLQRALAPIYSEPIDLRRASRLLIVGEVRVPRVIARVDAAGPPTRATIEVTPAAAVTTTSEASRVVVSIDADAIDLTLPAGGGGLISEVVAGDGENTLAVVLAAGAGAARANTSTAAGVTRVLVEVPAAGAPPAETAAPAPAVPIDTDPPLLPVRAVLQTIVLDPGHGGHDTGVRGSGGFEEKAFTLAVAQQLRGLIESQLGIRVVLTRDDDRHVALDERTAMANNSKADLFLSLHANAALGPSVAGAEVFHLQLDREGEDARRDAAADAQSLPVIGGGTRVIDVIRWDLAQARYIETSALLATVIEDELRRSGMQMGPQPLQRAPIRVLTGANMPATLIEMAYLTNPTEEGMAATTDHQNRLAQAIYTAIVRFRAHLEERRTG